MQASAQRRFTVRRQSTVQLINSPTAASRYNTGNAGGAVTRRPASPGSGSGGGVSPHSYSFEAQWDADDDEDVDADKPLTCAGRLAFPFVWLYRRLFVDLREADDDFDTILRKIVISAGVPLVVFPVTFALYLASELAQTEITIGGLVTLIVMFVFPLVWIPAFLYVRHTKEVPFAVIDTWLIATTLGVGVLTVSLIEYPTPQLAFFLLVMAMLCRTPRVILHVFLLTGVYGTAMANQAISGLNPVTDEPLATVPDPYRGSLLERVAYQITGMFIGAIIASAVIMQTRENARMMARSATAAVVARQVANQLATYDTDAAKETLRGFARGNRAEVDLTSAFYAIVENLELYRPHLPGWIMQAHDEERERARQWAEGGEGHLEPFDFAGQQQDPLDSSAEQNTPTNGGAGTRQHRQRQRRMRRAAAANDPDLDLEVDIRIESVSNSPSDGPLSPSDNGSLDGGNGGVVVVRRGGGGGAGGGGPQSRTPMMASLLNASSATRAFFGKATFAMLHVDMKLSPADAMTPAYDKLIDACCTRLHEVCALLHGIVHSIAGDTVLMSWNAISRTAVPETKCAKAMAQLVSSSGDSDVVISGMAMTDYVRCHHYGATSKLFGARLPHKNTLWAVSLYARDRQAMLVDETAFRTAHGDVEMFPADVLRVQEWRVRDGADMYSAGPSPKNPTTNNGRLSAQNSPSVNTSLHAHTQHSHSTERSLGAGSTLTAPPTGLRSPSTGLNSIQPPPAALLRGNSTLSASMQRGSSLCPDGLRDLRVYEVIREHPSETTDADSRSVHHTASEHSHGDEWMYVLQRRARGGARRGSGGSTMSEAVDPIDVAIRHALRGRYTEALEHVKDFIKQLSAAAAAAEFTAFSDNGTGAPPPGSIDETAGGCDPLSGDAEEPDLNATGKRNSGSSNGTDVASDPPTHAHLNNTSTSGAFADLPAPLQISTGGNDCGGKVPRVVLRLKQRLQQLIAIKAGPDDFPTVCVLGYGGNWAAFDASPLSNNLLTPAASFTTSKQRRSSAQDS